MFRKGYQQNEYRRTQDARTLSVRIILKACAENVIFSKAALNLLTTVLIKRNQTMHAAGARIAM